jgi:hypothetical protein
MNDNTPLEDRVNQALDDSVDNLSPEVRRQLNQIRLNAVERKKSRGVYWKTAGAMSFALALTLGWQLWPEQAEPAVELYADVLEEDLDMLDELEFIYWMAEENDSALL